MRLWLRRNQKHLAYQVAVNCVIGNFNKSGIVGYNQCELLQKNNELSRACANNDDEEKQKYLNYLDLFNF